MLRKILPIALGVMMTMAAYGQQDTSSVTVQVITDKDNKKVIIDADGTVWQQTTKRKNVSTSWIGGFDLGFANFVDHTDYASSGAQAFAPGADASWFDLRNGKSINFNLWIVSQKVNLIHHNVNLKYALGLELNNYRFKNPVRFSQNAPYVRWDDTDNRVYTKNKLAADYVTIPLMLNFDFGRNGSVGITKSTHKGGKGFKLNAKKSREWGFSAGISAGYLYSARQKTITSDEGKGKLKDNFNLNPWKLSYIGEINLGYFSIYGAYSLSSMFKEGLDMTPYTVGIRF